MKALVFLLVLFNLLFYAFTQGYFGKPENPDADRIDKQVFAERMRIVSRGEVPAPSAKAPEPVKPAIVVEEAKVLEMASKVEEAAAPICLAWAHLSVAEADRINSLLAYQFADFKVTRQAQAGESESTGWWVFVPPLPGKAEADKKAGELRQLGVTDYFIIPDGPNRFAISLGIFSTEKGGQERLLELKGKGVRSARLTPRPGKDGTVSLQATGPEAARSGLLEAVGKVLPKTEAQDCH